MTTYTHVGGRAAVGYQHDGRNFEHREKRAGRRHALNRAGRNYRAVCGVVVSELSSDRHDQGEANPVRPAGEVAVTCKKCLKCRPVVAVPQSWTEFRLMYEAGGEVRCWAASARRAEVEQWTTFLTEQRGADRTWVEEVKVAG